MSLHCMDTLAEWSRHRPAKPMGSPRVGSNSTGVDFHLSRKFCFRMLPSRGHGEIRRSTVRGLETLMLSSARAQVLPLILTSKPFALICSFFQAF